MIQNTNICWLRIVPPLLLPSVRGAAQGGGVEPAEPADQRPAAGPAAAGTRLNRKKFWLWFSWKIASDSIFILLHGALTHSWNWSQNLNPKLKWFFKPKLFSIELLPSAGRARRPPASWCRWPRAWRSRSACSRLGGSGPRRPGEEGSTS